MLDGGDDPHDCRPWCIVAAGGDVLAARRLVRPGLPRQLLVDDGHGHRSRAIIHGKIAAGKTTDAERPEIARTHDIELSRRCRLWIGDRLVGDEVWIRLAIAVERRRPNECRALHAGHPSYLVERSREHVGGLRLRLVLRHRQTELKRERVRRIEAGIYAGESSEASRE